MASQSINIAEGMPQLDEARIERLNAFAGYVAFLPWFNIDVLHKLYINVFSEAFGKKKELDQATAFEQRSITCIDLLDSLVISRIGYNVFIMESDVRDALRNSIQDQAIIRKLGEFMLAYAAQCRHQILSIRYIEVYKIEGNLIVNPTAEAKRIAQHIAQELNRKSHFNKMQPAIAYFLNRLDQDDHKRGHEQLTGLLKGLNSYFDEDETGAGEAWKELKGKDAQAESITIKLPVEVRKAIVEKIEERVQDEQEAEGEKDKRMRVWLDERSLTEIQKDLSLRKVNYVVSSNPKFADFWIQADLDREGYLITRTNEEIVLLNPPTSIGMRNALRHLGNWFTLLYLNNPDTNLSKNDVNIIIDVVQADSDPMSTDNWEGFPVLRTEQNPDHLNLNYSEAHGEQFPPGIRLKISRRNEEKGKQENDLYISILSVDSKYGIRPVIESERISTQELTWEPGIAITNFEDYFHELGITQITDYLKIFISRDKIPIAEFQQLPLLPNDSPIKKSAIRSREFPVEQAFQEASADWTSLTIPINIHRPFPNRATWYEIPPHEEHVTSVAFSPDGNAFLTGGADHRVILWSEHAVPVQEFLGHDSMVTSVDFSPNGELIFAIGKDGKGILWNRKGEQEAEFELVHAAAFSPEGKFLVFGGKDRGAGRIIPALEFYGLPSDENPKTPSFGGQVEHEISSIAFSSDGQQIMTGHADGSATLWKFNSQGQGKQAAINQLSHFENHQAAITSVAFSQPNQEFILMASADGTASLSDRSGESRQIFSHHADAVNAASFFPKESWFILGSNDRKISLWDMFGERRDVFERALGRVTDLAISPDGTKLLVAAGGQFVPWMLAFEAEGRFASKFILPRDNSFANHMAFTFRSSSFGELGVGESFAILPQEGILVEIRINVGSLIEGVEFYYQLPGPIELVKFGFGRSDGNAMQSLHISSTITRISGAFGDVLHQLQFHFADGTSSPVYGSEGGKVFNVLFEQKRFVGVYGHADEFINELGFFAVKEENESR